MFILKPADLVLAAYCPVLSQNLMLLMHCHQEDRKSEAFDRKPVTKLASWQASSQG